MNHKPIALLSLLLLFSIGIQSACSSSEIFFPIVGFPDPGPDLPRIYITNDGDVKPETAPIERTGNTYTLTDNIVLQTIVIQRDNIVLNGSGYLIQGNASWMGLEPRMKDYGNNGVIIAGQYNVNLTNLKFQSYSSGVRISGSSNINIAENFFTKGTNMMDSSMGVVIEGSSQVLVENNIFTDTALAISANGTDITIKSNTLHSVLDSIEGSIYLEGSYNRIEDNTLEGSSVIILANANHNTIQNNSLNGPSEGIFLISQCTDNLFAKNNFTGYSNAIRMNVGRNNVFYGNLFEDNWFALEISGWGTPISADNLFYGNIFTANSTKIRINDVTGTRWDNGSIGNYWSDYNGLDGNGDGIGSTPYTVTAYKWSNEARDDINFTAGEDNYPLMQPYNAASGTAAKPSVDFPLVLLVVCAAVLLACVSLLIYRIKHKLLKGNSERVFCIQLGANKSLRCSRDPSLEW